MTKLKLACLSLTGALLLGGCAGNIQQPTEVRIDPHSEKLMLLRMARYEYFQQLPSHEESDDGLWALTRTHLQLNEHLQHTRVEEQLNWFQRYPRHLTRISKQAEPYYYYVLDQVLERGMPAEVALLPIIESGYNPHAVSPSQAVGTWQFIPGTATHFGLERNWWYDARRDIVASTEAALTYLSQLNEMFDGDWLLTFAAYNAGQGTVMRAQALNRARGLPDDYWSLQLPSETMYYVPRLLATADMILHADNYGIELTEIPAEPYFAEVDTGGQVDLSQAAELAEIDLDELKQLNPGFSRWATAPEGPHRLLVPASQAEQLQQALTELAPTERVNYAHHRIQSGDTLSAIARRYGTTVAILQSTNQLKGTHLRIGQTLLVPSAPSDTKVALRTARAGSG